jgi:hypothetical protein
MESDARYRSSGFRKALEAIDEDLGFSAHSYRPDLFFVDEEQKTVFVIEVTDCSGVSKKAEKIGYLWFALDCFEWSLVVLEVDVTTGWRCYDAAEFYFTQCLGFSAEHFADPNLHVGGWA